MSLGLTTLLRTRLEKWLTDTWFAKEARLGDKLWFALTYPLCALTARVAKRRRETILARFKENKTRPAVLVVGNVIVGGAGKTPIVLALAHSLSERGWRPALLCRGHGASGATAAQWVDAQSPTDVVGDEAILLAQRSGLPVVAARQRADGLRLIEQQRADIDLVISDDGLQHVGLRRTVELAVFDRRGAGNRRLLPAGPLREPLRHLSTVDALILNQGTDTEPVDPPVAHSRMFRSRLQVDELQPIFSSDGTPAPVPGDGPVAAIAGIGHPDGFFNTLRARGYSVREIRPGDHRGLSAAEISAIPEGAIFMTDKDAVKYRTTNDPRLWVLRVSAQADKALITWLDGTLRGQTTA